MPLPARISASVVSQIPLAAGSRGPFEDGANIYAALYDSTGTDKIRMFNSADGIAWTEQDTANAPLPYSGFAGALGQFDVIQAGSVLYVAFLNKNTAEINIASFNTGTNLCGAIITGGPVLGSSDKNLCFVRRSNGDFVAAYRYYDSPANENDIRAVLYNGSWGAPFTAYLNEGGTTNLFLCGLSIDASDRTYIWALHNRSVAGAGGWTDVELVGKTYTSAGVLSAEFSVSVDHDVCLFFDQITIPQVYTDVDSVVKIGLAYARGFEYASQQDNLAGLGHMAYVTAVPADSPTFTKEEISYLNNPAYPSASQIMFVAVKAGVPSVLWLSNPGNSWDVTYNSKTASWAARNSIALNLPTSILSATGSDLQGLEGRYLPVRDKFGFLFEGDSIFSFGTHYMEI